MDAESQQQPFTPEDAGREAERERIAREAYGRAVVLADMRESIRTQGKNIDKLVGVVDKLATALSAKPSRKEVITFSSVLNLIVLVILLPVLLILLTNSHVNRDTLSSVRECTIPGTVSDPHECYDAGQARTAQVVTTLTCNEEAVIRFYLKNIPGINVPPVTPACVGTVAP